MNMITEEFEIFEHEKAHVFYSSIRDTLRKPSRKYVSILPFPYKNLVVFVFISCTLISVWPRNVHLN